MGRRVPLAMDDLSLHPILSFSLLLSGVAAAIAMITMLCGVRFRRRSSQPKPSSSSSSSSINEKNMSSSIALPQQPPLPTPEDIDTKKVLPLPPSKLLKETNSCSQRNMTKSASTRNLITTMSMKLPRSLSMVKTGRSGDHQDDKYWHNLKKKGKLLKHEDSVWKKTIILGEKCRVPDEDEVTVYDGKGNRISTYHPKTPTSLPVSRQNSQIDLTAIPNNNNNNNNLKIPFSLPVSRQNSHIDYGAIPHCQADQVTRKQDLGDRISC